MTTRSLARIVLPASLAGVGMYLLVGCIPVPGSFQPSSGEPRPEARIGGPAGTRPLKLTRSTREDVLYVLGPLGEITPDGRTLVYDYFVVGSYWVMPLCFYAVPMQTNRSLRIDFDDAGVLRSFKVYKDDIPRPHGSRIGDLMPYTTYQKASGAAEGDLPLPPLPASQPADKPRQ